MKAGFKPKGVFDDDPEPDDKKKSAKEALEDLFKPKPKRKYSGKRKKDLAERFNDDFDTIYEAYTNPKKRNKLSFTQALQLARWKFARQWISDFEPPSDIQVVEALKTEFGISQRQAYTDVLNCKRLFASVTKVNQEFEKVMFIERLLRTRRKAMELNTAKGFDVASRCDAILAKVQGYDREQHELPVPVIVQVMTTTDLTAIGLQPVENLPALLKSFWKKKEEEKLREIQDVDYDDIMNNPRNESEHRK